MEFDVTREQWIERFVIRLANLVVGGQPDAFIERAGVLWPSQGSMAPEAAAEAEFAFGPSAPERSEAFERTETFSSGAQLEHFERTERIPVERIETAGEYVRDTDTWIARCVARVLQLDPIIKADEARRSVTDLAELERWRLMKPEAAAEQLYTPIKLRPG